MSKPATLNDAVALVRASRLVPEDRLRAFLASVRQTTPLDELSPDALIGRLVAAGVLTKFHGDHLRAGRSKGFVLGPYRLLDRLGAGGMGVVYLAEHTGMGRRVAVKVLSVKGAAAPLAMERFVREARAAARVDHPNIVHVFDVEAKARPPYLVMEYVDGLSLQAAVARHGPFAAGEAAHCGRQAALGLHAAHLAGLVHRDVKPANLLVDRRGAVKLLDLGIVRVVGESITHMGGERQLLGTLDYLAPEQSLNSSAVDTRADVYALGGTLYFLLAGRPPFPDGTPRDKMLRLHGIDPDPLAELRPDVPAGLAAVVHRMLAKAADDRYPTPAEAAEALAPWAAAGPAFPGRLFGGKPAADEAGEPTAPTGPHTPLPVTVVAGPTVLAPPAAVSFDPPPAAAPDEQTIRTQLAAADREARAAERRAARRPIRPSRTNVVWVAAGVAVVVAVVAVIWAIGRPTAKMFPRPTPAVGSP